MPISNKFLRFNGPALVQLTTPIFRVSTNVLALSSVGSRFTHWQGTKVNICCHSGLLENDSHLQWSQPFPCRFHCFDRYRWPLYNQSGTVFFLLLPVFTCQIDKVIRTRNVRYIIPQLNSTINPHTANIPFICSYFHPFPCPKSRGFFLWIEWQDKCLRLSAGVQLSDNHCAITAQHSWVTDRRTKDYPIILVSTLLCTITMLRTWPCF